jgi:5,10-methylenetetrahydromethanopterin reductase
MSESDARSQGRKLTFGIRFPPAEGPESSGALAKAAEEAGFKWIWGVDTPLLAGGLFDPYVDLVACAMNTKTAMIGPAVSPLFLRTPVATAAAILSLDRISNGRAVLGMGSGGSALVTLGVSREENLTYTGGARERQDLLLQEVALMRRLFAGEAINLGKRDIQLDGPRSIKIYLAASGPRMLDLAGQVADGVIVHVGIWEPAIEDAVTRIRAGAEKAGRNPDEVDIVCSTYTAISEDGDRQADIRHVKPEASFFYSMMPRLVEKAGFDISRRFPERMPHPDMTHAYDWDEAMAAADTYIPDKIVEMFCLVGPPDEAIERIRRLAALGVTQVYIRGTSSYRLPHDLVATVGRHILPHFSDDH